MFVVTAILLTISLVSAGEECAKYSETQRWANGLKGNFAIKIPKATRSWKLEATFDNPIQSGDFWAGQKTWTEKSVKVIGDGNDWSAKQKPGKFNLGFTINYRQNGPKVKFASVKITLCWLYGSECATCDVFGESVKACNGAYIRDATRRGKKNGALAVMPAKCYDNMPSFTLTFTGTPKYLDFSDSRLKSVCKGKVCDVSADNYPLEFNELLKLHVSYPSSLKLVGIMFDGKDVCTVKPTKLPEQEVAPTLPPAPVFYNTIAEDEGYGDNNDCYEHDIAYPHNDIDKRFNVQSAKECARLCYKFKGCESMTYRTKHKRCFLKSVYGDIHRQKIEDAISASLACLIRGNVTDASRGDGSSGDVLARGTFSVKEEQMPCPEGVIELPNSGLEDNEENKMLNVSIIECAEDMQPIKMEFDFSIRNLIVPRGRYVAAHNDDKTVWTIKTEKPMRVKKQTMLNIKVKIAHYDSIRGPAKVVGLKYADRDLCHATAEI